ncbi:MAG: hypothetical protein ACI4SS_04795, partial [Clostridia bacterium]
SDITLDESTWKSVASITNNGFDSYSLMDLWYTQSMDGARYNNKVRLFVIKPRTVVTFEYQGWYSVGHMVWFQNSLEPVGKATVFDTGIWG